MKKLVLMIVFLFSVGSLTQLNASNQKIEEFLVAEKSCAEIAYDLQGDLEDNGVDKETANEVATLIYEICEANQ